MAPANYQYIPLPETWTMLILVHQGYKKQVHQPYNVFLGTIQVKQFGQRTE